MGTVRLSVLFSNFLHSHIEAPSNMFGSALNYVCARLLGMNKDDEMMVNARKFIHQHGTFHKIIS